MSDIATAVEAVKNQARAFRAVLAVAEVLEQIGDLERRQSELVAANAVAQTHLDAVTEEAVKVREQAKADADQLRRDAAEAQKAAETALAQARVDADDIRNQATQAAAAVKAQSDAEVAAADALLADKGAQLQKLQADIDAATVSLAQTNTDLATAQAAVRKMFGQPDPLVPVVGPDTKVG